MNYPLNEVFFSTILLHHLSSCSHISNKHFTLESERQSILRKTETDSINRSLVGNSGPGRQMGRYRPLSQTLQWPCGEIGISGRHCFETFRFTKRLQPLHIPVTVGRLLWGSCGCLQTKKCRQCKEYELAIWKGLLPSEPQKERHTY